MAVDVSKIPNNSKFDPVREAILQLQKDVGEGVVGVGSINGIDGNVILSGGNNINIANSPSTKTITVNTDADIIVDSLQFTGGTGTQGTLSWNADEETIDIIQNGATLQVGQETQVHVKNQTGATIPDGTPVYVTGTLGASGRLTVAPMIADGSIEAKYFLGVTTESIPNGEDGKVTTFGKIRGLDTSAYSEGTTLYVSATTAGAWQTTVPVAPNLDLEVAIVINVHANNGTIFVRAQNGLYLGLLHDVYLNSPADGQILVYNDTNSRWENFTHSFITLGDLSATTNPTPFGSGALLYDQLTGTFEYTPPDLSSFITTDENDYLTDALWDSATGIITFTVQNQTNVTVDIDGRYLELSGGTIDGDLAITGDLTVSGTTTYINTDQLNIGDNIIQLNADLPPTTAPTENAGIEINRGSSANVSFLWDETNDRWTLGSNDLELGSFVISGGSQSEFLKADGSTTELTVVTNANNTPISSGALLYDTLTGNFDYTPPNLDGVISETAIDNKLLGYLPLTGGTVTGLLTTNDLTVLGTLTATIPEGPTTDGLQEITDNGNTTTNSITIDTGTTNGAKTGLILNRPAAGTNYHGFVLATDGTVNWSIGQNSNDNLEFYEEGLAVNTRLTIEQGGNVGINQTNPSKKLHVKTDDNEGMFLEGTSTGVWFDMQSGSSELWSIGADSGGYGVYNRSDARYRFRVEPNGRSWINTTDDDYALGFYRNNTPEWWLKAYSNGDFAIHEDSVGDRLNIKNGKVGIGNTSPQDALDVSGNITIQTDPTVSSLSTWYSASAVHNTVRVTNGSDLYFKKNLASNTYSAFVYNPEQVGLNFDISFKLTLHQDSGYRHFAIAIASDGSNTYNNFDNIIFRDNATDPNTRQIRIDVAGISEQSIVGSSLPAFADGTERHVLIQVRNRDYSIEIDGVQVHKFTASARTRSRGVIGHAIYESTEADSYANIRQFQITQYAHDVHLMPDIKIGGTEDGAANYGVYLQNNKWYATQYSPAHDVVRMNANTVGWLDIYNQTDAGFTGINVGDINILDSNASSGVLKMGGTTTIDASRNVTANSFVKDSGTQAQFLKADGTTTTLNVVTNPTPFGSGALLYNTATGEFDYTPPDIAGFITEAEVDTKLLGYLPLAGGTLTGLLTGTDATFFGSVTATDLKVESGASNSIRIGDGFGSGGSATIHNYLKPLYLQYNNGVVSGSDAEVRIGGGGTISDLNLIGGGNVVLTGRILMNRDGLAGDAIDINHVENSDWPFVFRSSSVGNDNDSGFWVNSDGTPDMRLRATDATVTALIHSNGDSYINGGGLAIGQTSVDTGYKLAVNGSIISGVSSGNTSVVVATSNANGAFNAIENTGLEIASDSTNKRISFRTGTTTRGYFQNSTLNTLYVNGSGYFNGVRLGRDFSIADRATLRLDANGANKPSDILFGHTPAANQSDWTGVEWSLSSRGTSASNKFYFYRGSGQPAPYNSEAILMSFDPSMKVGIGTDSPASKFHVYDSGGTLLTLQSTTSSSYSEMRLQANDSSAFIWKQGSTNNNYGGARSVNYLNNDAGHHFHVDGVSNILNITSSGNVGVNVTNAVTKLHVSSSSSIPSTGAVQDDSKFLVSGVDGNMDLLSTDDNSTVANGIGFGRFNSSTGALIHKFGIVHWANTGSQGSNTGDRLAFTYGTNKNTWSNSDIFTVLSSGQVGIGKTSGFGTGGFGSPRLVIKQSESSAWGGVNVEASGNDSVFSFSSTDSAHYISASYRSTAGYKPIYIATSGQTRLKVQTDGKVCINTDISQVPLNVNSDILIDAFSKGNEHGVFFRENFATSNKYNVGIMAYDHNGGGTTPDGLTFGAYDGISFCTGANTRQERMRVQLNGNVGVGSAALTTNNIFQAKGAFTTDSGALFNTAAGQMIIAEYAGGSTPVPFAVRNSTLGGDTSMNFGTLHIDRIGAGVGGGSNMYFRRTDSAGVWREYAGVGGVIGSATTGSYGGYLNFYVSNNGSARLNYMRLDQIGKLHVANDVIAFSTTVSDARLKDDVHTIDNAIDKVKALRGVEYVWNKGGREGQKDLGFIAQEVEQVIPEIVRENEMPLIDDSGEKYKTVDYEKVVAVLVEAMKEQQKQIDELKARLDGSTK